MSNWGYKFKYIVDTYDDEWEQGSKDSIYETSYDSRFAVEKAYDSLDD